MGKRTISIPRSRGRKSLLVVTLASAAIALALAANPTGSLAQPVECSTGRGGPSDCLLINNVILLPIDENFPPGGMETRLTLDGNFGVWAVVLTEPRSDPDTNEGVISDVLISNGAQLLVGSDDPFHVNMPGGLVPPPDALVMPEIDGFIDLTGLLPPGGGTYIPVPGTIILVTSLAFASDTPEPATLLLLASGFLGVGLARRRYSPRQLSL